MKKHNQPSPEILSSLSFNVRRLRKARGYTQHGLAKLCQFADSYVGDIEQETVNITLGNLERLTIGLNCAVYDLFAPIQKDRQ